MKNIFEASVTAEIVQRLQSLSPDQQALWGKMTVAQMLAHCCVTYEMVYETKHPKPNAFVKLMLKLFVKPAVVGTKPYKRSGQTAPAFLIQDDRNFESERERLIGYIRQTQALGAAHFDGKESHSFGPLTKEEWNAMFYKHLDHHLGQFGV